VWQGVKSAGRTCRRALRGDGEVEEKESPGVSWRKKSVGRHKFIDWEK